MLLLELVHNFEKINIGQHLRLEEMFRTINLFGDYLGEQIRDLIHSDDPET